MSDGPRLFIAGATGVTGARVARAAHAAGLPMILAGRDVGALARLGQALGGVETRELDLTEPGAVDRAVDGAEIVVNCVGPFGRHGLPVAEAAVRNGLPYVDPSGEPAYCLTLIRRFGDAPTPLVTAVGLSSLLADLGAAISLRDHGPASTLILAYELSGLRPSAGTARSSLDILGGGAIVVRNGVPHHALPGGAAMRFAVPDPLVISRYHPARSIDAYLRTPAPRVMGAVVRAASRACASDRVRATLDGALRRLPLPSVDRPGRYAVTAVADGHRTTAACTDVYGLTAAAIVRVATALSTGDFVGVRAASEVLGNLDAAARHLNVAITTEKGSPNDHRPGRGST